MKSEIMISVAEYIINIGYRLGLWRWQIFTTAVVMDQLPPVARCCVYLYIYIYK